MAPLRRNVAADFARDVAARTGIVPGHVWQAVLNSDNTTYNVTLNGTVKFAKIYWPGPAGGAVTDSTFGDSIIIYAADGTTSVSDTLQFLNNLN